MYFLYQEEVNFCVTNMGVQYKHMYFDHIRHRNGKDLEIISTQERDHKRPPFQRMTGKKMVCDRRSRQLLITQTRNEVFPRHRSKMLPILYMDFTLREDECLSYVVQLTSEFLTGYKAGCPQNLYRPVGMKVNSLTSTFPCSLEPFVFIHSYLLMRKTGLQSKYFCNFFKYWWARTLYCFH